MRCCTPHHHPTKRCVPCGRSGLSDCTSLPCRQPLPDLAVSIVSFPATLSVYAVGTLVFNVTNLGAAATVPSDTYFITVLADTAYPSPAFVLKGSLHPLSFKPSGTGSNFFVFAFQGTTIAAGER